MKIMITSHIPRRRFIEVASATAVLHPLANRGHDAATKPRIKIGRIGAAAADATRKQKVFLVHDQMPTDPNNIEAVRRIQDPGFGPVLHVQSSGTSE